MCKVDPLFNKFQLLKLKQIRARQFQILGFMYKFTHGLLPLDLMITFAHNLTSIHTTQEQQVTLH